MADNFLTKKIGPLPAWGWGAMVGGGAFLLMKKKSAAGGQAGGSGGGGSSSQPPNDAGNYSANIKESVDTNTSYTNAGYGWGGGFGFPRDPFAGGGAVFVNLFRNHDGGYHGGWDHRHHDHMYGRGGQRRDGWDNNNRFNRGGGRGGGGGRGRGKQNTGWDYKRGQSNNRWFQKEWGPNSSRYARNTNNDSSRGNTSGR